MFVIDNIHYLAELFTSVDVIKSNIKSLLIYFYVVYIDKIPS